MNTDIYELSVLDFWTLPQRERDAAMRELVRRFLFAVPSASWSDAENSVVCAFCRYTNETRVEDAIEDVASIEAHSLAIDRQIRALECFGSHGRCAEHVGRVYFLRAGPFVKIGFTSGAPAKRIRELSTGCPYKPILIGIREATRATETWLHHIFAGQRVNLEWFHATNVMLRAIELLSEDDFIISLLEGPNAGALLDIAA